MRSAFSSPAAQDPTHTLFIALAATCAGITLLLGFILLRRLIRSRYFRIRDARARLIRANWEQVLREKGANPTWLMKKLDCRIVEEIALDRMEVASKDEMHELQAFFRSSGLLDRKIREVRTTTGWDRRKALLCLGCMQLPEGVPALAEALDDSSEEVVVDAIRALGLVGAPDAGERIVQRIVSRPVQCPSLPLQAALANCFRGRTSRLLKLVGAAGDGVRPVLARALAEVATPKTTGELRDLADDPLPDVRASAARVLSAVRPPYVITALTELAGDPEWFVRLRAMVALGDLHDHRAIPVLIRGLCDSNRLVRLRAASALAKLEGEELAVLHLAIQTSDRYALQALVSELERSGRIGRLVNRLAGSQTALAEAALVAALQGGASRFLIDLMLNHRSARVRRKLMMILSRSQDPALLGYLEQVVCSPATESHGQSLRRLVEALKARETAGQTQDPVLAA